MPTVIPVKEQDVLGPDFCQKRPIFLNLELQRSARIPKTQPFTEESAG